MADEILGSAYEVITEIALRDYSTVPQKGEEVFSQKMPKELGIIPDLTVGEKLEHPRILIQIHHTMAEMASQKKFWRNIGEFVDARLALGPDTKIATITFDSGQKRKLSAASDHLLDGFLEVDRASFGAELLDFAKVLETEFRKGKVPEGARLAHTQKLLTGRTATLRAMKAFGNALDLCLKKASTAGANWFQVYREIQKKRPKPRIPTAKVTTLRRALGRLLPVEDEAHLRRLLHSVRKKSTADWPQFLISIGIAKKCLGGAKFVLPSLSGKKQESDPAFEIHRMLECFDDATIVSLWRRLRTTTTSLKQACTSIAATGELPAFHSFVLDHLHELTSTDGMRRALQDCFDDPGTVLKETVRIKDSGLHGVWIFEYVMTLIKTRTGKQQGYGYTRLAADSGQHILASAPGLVLSPFLQRRKKLPKEILAGISRALALKLKQIDKKWITNNASKINDSVLQGLFEDKIYKTSSFDPILALLEIKLGKALIGLPTRHSTFLTDVIGAGAATCDALVADNVRILWQAAFAGGVDHKTKELVGRIGMLRVAHSKDGKAKPSGFEKFHLVIDGLWTDEQIGRLASAGFDGIYYVDEIDELAKALKK